MLTFTFDLDSILILVEVIIFLIFHIISGVRMNRMRKTMEEFSLLLYQIQRDHNHSHDTLIEIDEYTKQLHEGFVVLEETYKNVHHETHMPTPQEDEQIDTTIRQLLSIEIILSADMTISRRDSVNQIIMNTIRTYPDIDKEYIIKKAASIIQTFIKS